eukprot:GGOE01036674.1.p2 GENE.GGOE01036674.1~~GGOE01036674.1.p2  ORF type:complete len:447 (+),score=117.91 GGOE01036674.1:69-1343(+)
MAEEKPKRKVKVVKVVKVVKKVVKKRPDGGTKRTLGGGGDNHAHHAITSPSPPPSPAPPVAPPSEPAAPPHKKQKVHHAPHSGSAPSSGASCRACTFEVDEESPFPNAKQQPREPTPAGLLELFLSNCPRGITDADIRNHYAPLGNKAITRIKWIKDQQGNFKHIGYVQFASEALAQKALKMPRPHVLDKTLKAVINFVPAEKKQVTPNVVEISGVPPEVTDDDIREWAEPCGEGSVLKVKRITHKDGSFRGLVLVQFFSASIAQQAAALPPPVFHGQTCRLRLYANTLTKDSPREIFLTKLFSEMNEQLIRNHYMWLGVGALERIRWDIGSGDSAQDVAFVRFRDEATCARALHMNPPTVNGRAAKVGLALDWKAHSQPLATPSSSGPEDGLSKRHGGAANHKRGPGHDQSTQHNGTSGAHID